MRSGNETLTLYATLKPSGELFERLSYVSGIIHRCRDVVPPCLLVVSDPNAEPESLRVPSFPFTVGRSTSRDLLPDAAGLSRRHFTLHREGDGFRVEDHQSRNGLWRNQQRVTGTVPLVDGDILDAGGLRFIVCLSEDVTPE